MAVTEKSLANFGSILAAMPAMMVMPDWMQFGMPLYSSAFLAWMIRNNEKSRTRAGLLVQLSQPTIDRHYQAGRRLTIAEITTLVNKFVAEI